MFRVQGFTALGFGFEVVKLRLYGLQDKTLQV